MRRYENAVRGRLRQTAVVWSRAPRRRRSQAAPPRPAAKMAVTAAGSGTGVKERTRTLPAWANAKVPAAAKWLVSRVNRAGSKPRMPSVAIAIGHWYAWLAEKLAG